MRDQKCRGGKRRTEKCRTKNAGLVIAGLENVGPEIEVCLLVPRDCVAYWWGAATPIYVLHVQIYG